MIRKKLSEISMAYKGMGFNERTEKPRLKVILYSFTIIFLFLNEILYVINNWNNVQNRVNGFKGLCVYMICAMYLVSALFMWKDTKLSIKIINENGFKFPFPSTEKRIILEKSVEEDARKLNTAWYYILNAILASGVLTSLLVLFINIERHGIRNVTVDKLYLPVPFYYPENFNNLLCYILSLILLSFLYLESTYSAQLTAVASMICMKLIQGDLKLLRLSLEEMDSLITDSIKSVELSDTKSNRNDVESVRTKMFVTYFVRHHYDIHRRVVEATKAMRVMAFTICSGISLMICLTVYSLVKINAFVFKIQELCYFCGIVYCKYCLDLMGENISEEDRNLRHALYNCAWLDKPLWFKKSLQLIMTRTTKTIEIRSSGLFALDLKSFMMTLQAAYSFYNMLINFNK